MLKGLYAKILTAIAFLATIFLYKREKRKSEKLEKEVEIQTDTIKKIKKAEKIIKKIRIETTAEREINAKIKEDNQRIIEDLKHEDNDRIATNNIKRLLNQNYHKD